MRSVIAFATLLAVLATPARAADPIVNYENVAIKVRGGVPSAEQVREAIMAAGNARRWQFTDDSPGRLSDAKELERMHGARTLAIWYASDLKRAVKYESRLTSGERAPMEANFDLELTSYQVKM